MKTKLEKRNEIKEAKARYKLEIMNDPKKVARNKSRNIDALFSSKVPNMNLKVSSL